MIPVLPVGIWWKKKSRLEKYLMNMYTCVYSMIHNRQKAEATQVSTDRWMDKQNVVHKQWNVQFSSVLSVSHVWLLATPWTAARQASLSITNS